MLDALDTGVYATCGACGAALTGDPVLGALAGAVLAALLKRFVVAGLQALRDMSDRNDPPPPAVPA